MILLPSFLGLESNRQLSGDVSILGDLLLTDLLVGDLLLGDFLIFGHLINNTTKHKSINCTGKT